MSNSEGFYRSQTLLWLFFELRHEYFRTGEFSLIHEFLAILDECERDSLLRELFWSALREEEWALADECLREGYPIVPSQTWMQGAIHDALEVTKNRPKVIEWLLSHGADVERLDESTLVTPLVVAAKQGWEEVVRLLLKAGADVNNAPEVSEKYTALMAAAANGQGAMVRLLLEAGADPSHREWWGSNAAELADSRGHPEVAQQIRNFRFVEKRRPRDQSRSAQNR